jgi:hypothetical protein
VNQSYNIRVLYDSVFKHLCRVQQTSVGRDELTVGDKRRLEMMWCGLIGLIGAIGAMECGAMEYGAMECGAMEYGAMEYGAMECGDVGAI